MLTSCKSEAIMPVISHWRGKEKPFALKLRFPIKKKKNHLQTLLPHCGIVDRPVWLPEGGKTQFDSCYHGSLLFYLGQVTPLQSNSPHRVAVMVTRKAGINAVG